MADNLGTLDNELFDTVVGQKPPVGVPAGKYTLVGWSIDTTGQKLIDEICQIAGYTPNSIFSQYILPHGHVTSIFVRKHALRVVSVGKYRMLMDLKNNQFVRTKTEVAALTNFVIWLEKQIVAGTDGIILIYHEMWKTSPGMLLEALNRFELLQRFKKVVKGFLNGYEVSKAKCSTTTKFYTIRVMAKVLLNDEDRYFTSAQDRSRAAFRIVLHLSESERQDLDAVVSKTGLEPHIMNFVCPFTNPVEAEEENLTALKSFLQIQNTFRPVFATMLRGTRQERKTANHLRRLLAENNIDYDKLYNAYDTGSRRGLDVLLKSEIPNAKDADLAKLLDILLHYFDPRPLPMLMGSISLNSDRKPRKITNRTLMSVPEENFNNTFKDTLPPSIRRTTKQEPAQKF